MSFYTMNHSKYYVFEMVDKYKRFDIRDWHFWIGQDLCDEDNILKLIFSIYKYIYMQANKS